MKNIVAVSVVLFSFLALCGCSAAQKRRFCHEFKERHGRGVVHFKFDSAVLDIAARETIKKYAAYATACRQTITLAGHTDIVGPKAYNIKLSARRADAAAGFFKTLGLNEQDLAVHAYGFEQLLAPGNSPEINALNRRVEILTYDK